MNNWNLIKTDVNATGWMTAYMNMLSKISKKQFKVINILGSLATNDTYNGKVKATPKVKVVGSILHYGVGLLFVVGYHLLWKNKIMKPTNFNGGLLGLVSGFFGVAIWQMLMKSHPNPPRISKGDYFKNLILAHVVFGVAAASNYRKVDA